MILILDEIQTGLGRTGKLLAEEHEGVEGDLTLIGKALSGGFYPVSAVLSNKEVLGRPEPGEHGSTFGGNPLGCAVARMALKVLVEEGMIENAARQGDRLLDGLPRPAQQHRQGRPRSRPDDCGRTPPRSRRRPSAYCQKLQAQGLLCKETHDHTIRVAPPLVITADQVDWIVEQFGMALKDG